MLVSKVIILVSQFSIIAIALLKILSVWECVTDVGYVRGVGLGLCTLCFFLFLYSYSQRHSLAIFMLLQSTY